ncbi:MAG: GNAT family N-acetyltransferase [Clostridia bacterium]|nr:GNAT family N-acetyltransferase [Clostridia bacterium]
MSPIRPAKKEDLIRVAEIEIFNYRLNFYPIFRDDEFYFSELHVPAKAADYESRLSHLWVYDDGVVKGFCMTEGTQLKKLFVEPVLQGQAIGAALLKHAMERQGVDHLWALEKNHRAIRFYARHGFLPTGERIPEEDTDEYLIRLART